MFPKRWGNCVFESKNKIPETVQSWIFLRTYETWKVFLSTLKTVSKALNYFREFFSNQIKLKMKLPADSWLCSAAFTGGPVLFQRQIMLNSGARTMAMLTTSVRSADARRYHWPLLQLRHSQSSESGAETAKRMRASIAIPVGEQHCCFCPSHFYGRSRTNW